MKLRIDKEKPFKEYLSRINMKAQKIEEQDLIDLGFEKIFVPKEDSGCDNDFYYYTLDLLDGPYKMCLISNSDDEAVNSGWYIELFDFPYNRFKYLQELTEFVLTANKIKYYGEDEDSNES